MKRFRGPPSNFLLHGMIKINWKSTDMDLAKPYANLLSENRLLPVLEQLQEKALMRSVHRPPFLHGID